MNFNIGKDILQHEYRDAVYNKQSANRLKVVRGLVVLAFCVFMARTIQLSLQENECCNGGINNQEIARRADIVDRNGVVLAKTVLSERANIKLFPKKVKTKDEDKVARFIKEIAPEKDAMALIHSGKNGVFIKMNADKDLVKRARETHKDCDCLDIEDIFERVYPQGNAFSHVIGLAGKDGGLEGVEFTYNKYLIQNKDPLVLSLDSRVQNIFREQLSIAIEKYEAKGAMGMLMKATTGEMIAMVQLPDFDPNDSKSYSDEMKEIRKFKLMRANFEMGSVFKIFNTALAYENGLQNREYTVDKPIYYHRNVKKPISDVPGFYRDIKEGKKPRIMTAPDIMKHSSNVGSVQIALDLPSEAQPEMFHRLHMNEILDLEYGKTEHPIIHKKWGPSERATASFGHGISVTPMHLLLAVNSMVNGGYYVYPTWLKRNIGSVQAERVLDPEISATLRKIMYSIAEETTGRNAKVPGVEIGGKTGTAEKRNPDGTPDKTRNVAVFAGIFPVSAPQYVMLVMLDEPKKTAASNNQRTAANNIVPTAGEILNSIIPLLFE